MLSRISAKPRCFLLPFSSILNHHYHPPTPTSHNSLPPPETPPNPDFTPHTVLETLYSYANDHRKALDFFNWVQTQPGFHHTTETYNRIIDILGRYFEFDKCRDLIENMGRTQLSLPNHTTFRIMFKRYVTAHLVDEAVNMFDTKMEKFGLKDQTSLLNLVDALCEYRHVVDAEELCFEDRDGVIKGCGFPVSMDTKIYNMILRGFYKVQRFSKCREYWEMMDRKGIQKDLFSYSIYMDIAVKSDNPKRALMIFEEMKWKGIRPDVVAYNTVIRARGKVDGVDFALSMFREMIESRCQPNVVTYNIILKLYCEHGRYQDMYRMLNDMRKKGCEPNVITFHGLFASIGKPKEIWQLFERMTESGIRPQMDTFVMLIRKFGRWGFLRPVLTVWEKIEEHGLSPDENAYNALIDALVQKGMIDMARKYDEEMFEKGLSPKPRRELETKPATVTGS